MILNNLQGKIFTGGKEVSQIYHKGTALWNDIPVVVGEFGINQNTEINIVVDGTSSMDVTRGILTSSLFESKIKELLLPYYNCRENLLEDHFRQTLFYGEDGISRGGIMRSAANGGFQSGNIINIVFQDESLYNPAGQVTVRGALVNGVERSQENGVYLYEPTQRVWYNSSHSNPNQRGYFHFNRTLNRWQFGNTLNDVLHVPGETNGHFMNPSTTEEQGFWGIKDNTTSKWFHTNFIDQNGNYTEDIDPSTPFLETNVSGATTIYIVNSTAIGNTRAHLDRQSLRMNLDNNNGNAAIFFHIQDRLNGPEHWKRTMEIAESEFAGTKYESQIDFSYEVAKGDIAGADYYVDQISQAFTRLGITTDVVCSSTTGNPVVTPTPTARTERIVYTGAIQEKELGEFTGREHDTSIPGNSNLTFFSGSGQGIPSDINNTSEAFVIGHPSSLFTIDLQDHYNISHDGQYMGDTNYRYGIDAGVKVTIGALDIEVDVSDYINNVDLVTTGVRQDNFNFSRFGYTMMSGHPDLNSADAVTYYNITDFETDVFDDIFTPAGDGTRYRDADSNGKIKVSIPQFEMSSSQIRNNGRNRYIHVYPHMILHAPTYVKSNSNTEDAKIRLKLLSKSNLDVKLDFGVGGTAIKSFNESANTQNLLNATPPNNRWVPNVGFNYTPLDFSETPNRSLDN